MDAGYPPQNLFLHASLGSLRYTGDYRGIQMKSFKEFLTAPNKPSYQAYRFIVDEYYVHMFFEGGDFATLSEARHKGLPLGGQYSAQSHPPHSAQGQRHLHVYAKNRQLFALNQDGSSHDASHKTHIPKKVADAIRGKFPHYTLPPNNFIEDAPSSVSAAISSEYLRG